VKKEHVLITLLIAACCGFFLGRLSIDVQSENTISEENLQNTARQVALREAATAEKVEMLSANEERKKANDLLKPVQEVPTTSSTYSTSERGEDTLGLRYAAYKGAKDPKVIIIESSDFQ
jgi:hypothetical protein